MRNEPPLNQIESPWAKPRAALVQGGISVIAAPTQQIANAGQQFARLEWLGQIIVSAQFQTENPVDRRAAGRHHDDSLDPASSAEFPAQIDTVAIWQVEIEHDQIDRLARQYLPHLGQACGDRHGKSSLTQLMTDHLTDVRIVVDDENAGGGQDGGSVHRFCLKLQLAAVCRGHETDVI